MPAFPEIGPILRAIALLAALCLAPTAATMADPASPLFPIVDNGKWGFIDTAGTVVIAPRLPDYTSFHDGLARSQEDGKPVFVDRSGKTALRPPFEIARDFSEGLAAVNIGERRIPTIGMIQETGRWGYIDRNGKLVLPMTFTQADSFSEGLAAVHDGKQGGFIDHGGKMVFKAEFDVSWGFHEGLALVKSHLKMAYLDRAGRRLPTPPLDDNSSGASFSEGLAAVEIGGLWGYVDKSGKLVIPATFRQAASFHEGLAAVEPAEDGPRQSCPRQADGSSYSFVQSYGYIDRSGRMVIPATHERASDFSEGLALVSTCRRSRFIDHAGKTIIAIPYDDADLLPFSNGLAAISVLDGTGLHRGYIDKQGKLVRPLSN